MDQQPKIFDSKMLLAVIIIGAFYVGWQQYLNHKYPHLNKPVAKEKTENSTANTSDEKKTNSTSDVNVDKVVDKTLKSSSPDIKFVQKPSREISYEDEKVKIKINSLGMAISGFEIKKYTDRKGQPISMAPLAPGLFEMQWGATGEPIPFDLEESEKGVFVGKAQVGSMTLTRELVYNPDSFSFTQKVKIDNPESITASISFASRDRIQKPESSSFLFPSYEHQDFLTFVNDKKELFNLSHTEEKLDATVKAINLYSLGTQYFTIGFLDKSELLSDLVLSSDLNSKTVNHSVEYKLPNVKEFELSNLIFVGPKSSENLKRANERFVELMDFGMLAFISKPMLASMKWFHSLVGNWGLAIIFLTLLVRAIVLPFNLMSYRSMKGMQKIQPLLTDIRERYKDDPVTLNREMMSIMKQNNANPLSGCLPILLQIPIFFALYRVIGSSVELYQAPFFAWIIDLSLHDKFFVLPILMGLTMYIQQKLTPTTLDPMQAKILVWMPVIFSVFMLYLPAGLTLYMVVSAIFGIVQQKTFMALMKS
ncbi:MAG: membrane protein insertase YidC [Bdellovibrionales bacterium]